MSFLNLGHWVMTIKGRKWFRREKMLTIREHTEFLPADHYRSEIEEVNRLGNKIGRSSLSSAGPRDEDGTSRS